MDSDEQMQRQLARVIYEAHARSRKLKTTWRDLGPEEKRHWYFVSTAAVSFFGEYADAIEEDTLG